jgi:hypothetical protein
MAAWSTPFDDPVPLPGGGQALTLRDAAVYAAGLPQAEQDLEAWQLAAGILLAAAEGRDFVMHARIAVLRAINRDKPPPAPRAGPNPARKFRIIS